MAREVTGSQDVTGSRIPDSANRGQHPGARPNQDLTSPALISLEYFPPPQDLAPFVTTFFLLRCDEPRIVDVQLAGVGILAVFMRGQGDIYFRDGASDPSHRINILTPLAAAATVAVAGPWHSFGAALSPLGWAALSGGRSAAKHGNRLLAAGDLFGPAFARLGDELADGWCEGRLGVAEMARAMGAAIAAALKPVPPQHVRLIGQVAQWLGESLSPRVDRLQDAVLYSPRQLQRLVDQYFGLPPKQLARKYRALRAASMLADPRTSEAEAAAIADKFYDQSHMIREIGLFAGRTPARLRGPDAPMLAALLDLRNFREIASPPPAS